MFKIKRLHLIAFVIVSALFSCKTTSSKVSSSQISTLKHIVENRRFTIESLWAYPQGTMATQQVLSSGLLPAGSSSGGINLIGNSNFLTISGDSITSYLPYFGERRSNIGYGAKDGAIQLKGIVENYGVTKGKRESFNISFDAYSKTEQFKVIIKLYPNLKSNLVVMGSSRTSISYSGLVKSIE